MRKNAVQLTIVVLAAGLSRRMGAANKLLQPFRGKTMLETTLDNLLEADLGADLLVVTGHESAKIRAAIGQRPVQIIENPRFVEGMTSSIQTGVAAAPSESAGFLICLGDMPLLDSGDYRRLALFFKNCLLKNSQAIAQPVFRGERGHPVAFSAFYKNEILENTEPEGCKPIVQRYRHNVALLAMANSHCLADFDRPEDFEDRSPSA